MDMHLPEPLHGRFARLPQSAEEATWVCPVCGVIAPRRTCLGSEVRYVRGRCACQQAEIERQERKRLQREWLDWQSIRTYSWLGRKWDDLALRRKTFENFDARRQPEAFEAARLFAEFPSGSLVLYGTFGTGKTHLLAAV